MTSYITPPCVSAHVVRQGGNGPEYLLIRRCSSYLHGTWQMVSGTIEEGETAWQAALREIKEETGLTPDKFYSADTVETFYMVSKDKVSFVPVFVGFVSGSEPIQLAPSEHDAYEWLPFEEAIERLIFTEQKRVLSEIDTYFVKRTPHPFLLIDRNLK